MLAEKKSLRRFLAVYIVSTILLLGAGTYFYYEVSLQSVVEKNILKLKSDVEKFVTINMEKRVFKTGNNPQYDGYKIAVYRDGEYFFGNFYKKDLDIKQEHILENNTLYYIDSEKKKWGELTVVSYIDINEQISGLKKNIFLFLFISVVFIIFIATLLGKIFLKPMKESIESLESFIGDATHEINTPISSVLINIELLKEIYPDFNKIEELRKIESATFRISKVFKDLSFVKLNHKQKKEIIKVDIDMAIKERLEFFSTFIDNKKISLLLSIEPVQLNIDKEDLIRLIDNLISNAIKYTKPKGSIDITLKQNLFRVVNDGEIKDTKKITNKFFRENRDEGGFGLGLYIVDKICKYYNFRLKIYTKDKKVHSEIYFTLH